MWHAITKSEACVEKGHSLVWDTVLRRLLEPAERVPRFSVQTGDGKVYFIK
jgi:hypothetical protein